MKTKATLLSIVLILIGFNSALAFWDHAHMNTAEDAIVFMETKGSNQQRWAADYIKAKSGGRYTGQPAAQLYRGNSASGFGDLAFGGQPGAIGKVRSGATLPDFTQDMWWDDTTVFNWKAPAPVSANYTSYTHFMDLLLVNDNGDQLITNNYNDYSGLGYNHTFGFPSTGIDYTIAVFMNDAWATVDLPGCIDCTDKLTLIPNGNSVQDYKQNGSRTPLGVGVGNKKVPSDNHTNFATNYNCYADLSTTGNCPDRGVVIGSEYQIPNTEGNEGNQFTGDQDWVIFEPTDNAATFYYNEWWLEGGATSYGSNRYTLQSANAANRYYSITHSAIDYMCYVGHFAGDTGVQVHIWVTTGYNHSGYEEWIDDNYGSRVLGGSDTSKNFEDYDLIKAHIRSRANGIDQRIDTIITENGFNTFFVRFRSGYDIMTNTDAATRKRTATYAVNTAIGMLAMIYEKAVIDLRNYR